MIDRVLKSLDETKTRLAADYQKDAVNAPLDDDGDAKRREAAAKHRALEDLHKKFKEAIKRELA